MSEKVYCGNCFKNTLSSNPAVFNNLSVHWISLLEGGIPALCPSCGPIYMVAKVISKSPAVPTNVRNISGIVCGFLLFLAGLKYLDKLISRT